MKFGVSTWSFLLFLLVSCWCHAQLQALSQLNKERIQLGVEAAKSTASALKAMKFVSWAANIGKVAGPALTAVSIILDIVFAFLDIESPEMIFMKAEFKNLNTRLDSFSLQFEEVKKKIDWSTVQLNYQKHEANIYVLNQQRMGLTNAKTRREREERKEEFIKKFEFDFKMATEALFLAMTTESVLSDNIFKASQKYTDQHPELSFRFMQGSAQLLLQAITIQGTYIHVKYNNTHANEYFKELSDAKMKCMSDSATRTYNTMKFNWHNQMKRDVNRIAHANRGLGHNYMTSKLFNYFSAKYIDRIWFTYVYNELWTYEKHAVYVCGGGYFFRIAGRNIIVASQDKHYAYHRSGFSTTWATNVLNSFGQFRRDHDGALGVLERIQKHNRGCAPAAAIVVVGHGNDGYFINNGGRSVQKQKSVKWCNTDLCWVWKVRYYAAIIFG